MLSGNFKGSEIWHGIFWGLVFGPGIFWGFVGSPFGGGVLILPPFDHPHHLKSRVPPSLWAYHDQAELHITSAANSLQLCVNGLPLYALFFLLKSLLSTSFVNDQL